MSPADPDSERLLLQVAEEIADARPVTWDEHTSGLTDPELRSRFDKLRMLERVALAFRTGAPSAVDTDERAPVLFTWGHLEVREKLGEGGFGEVYRAYDPVLDREVALKLRKQGPSRRGAGGRRYIREARRLARLRHPHVISVHGADEHDGRVGFWTDLIDGQTLADIVRVQGPLSAEEALSVGRVICSALAAVHGAGLVHGDVKASNVMRERGGRVVLMDLGAASLMRTGAEAEPTDQLQGTPVAMAPELLSGAAPTAAADIYALGALLYYLVSGTYPVRAESYHELVARHRDGDLVPLRDQRPDLPSAFLEVVEWALAPEPEDRLPSAGAMERALGGVVRGRQAETTSDVAAVAARPLARRCAWAAVALVALLALALVIRNRWSGLSPSTSPPRLAVLPFEDLGTPDDAYFAAGLTEEILSRLATVQGLQVLSRTTMVSYDRTGKTVKEIGRDLDVEYLLEGTVRWDRVGGLDRLRVTPQLIRVADDSQLWADRYDRNMADVFAVQSDIASHVVRALGVTLSEREKRLVEKQPTANLEAYQLYLRGLQSFADGTRDVHGGGERYYAMSADLMRRATELDPSFALAHARLAFTLTFQFFGGSPTEYLVQARTALTRAQALAPEHPEVRVAAGYLHYWGDGDYARALAEFEAATAEMPSYAEAHGAAGAVLRRLGRYEEAIVRLERNRELLGREGAIDLWDVPRNIALCLWTLRRYAEADRIFEEQLKARPDSAGRWAERAVLWTHWRGTTDGAWALLAEAPESVQRELFGVRVYLHLLDRDFAAAVGAVSGETFTGELTTGWIGVAYALRRLGREAEATDLARRIVTDRQSALAANPDASFLHQHLGLAHALLGEREPALEHARRAVELLASDAWWGAAAVERLARVHTLLGDRGEAVRLVTELLTKDYEAPLNAHRLKLEPWWDPLREDPQFQALLAESEAGAG